MLSYNFQTILYSQFLQLEKHERTLKDPWVIWHFFKIVFVRQKEREKNVEIEQIGVVKNVSKNNTRIKILIMHSKKIQKECSRHDKFFAFLQYDKIEEYNFTNITETTTWRQDLIFVKNTFLWKILVFLNKFQFLN